MVGPARPGPAETAVLLDTHAWVWWVSGSQELPESTRGTIQNAFVSQQLWVSAISAWEVALLVERGRLILRLPTREWVTRSESLAGLHFLPIDHTLAIRAVELPGLHADPADRLIVASAERLGAVLVTRDQRLRDYNGVATQWA